MEETYLGDAVYASFDGYQIWLRTGDGYNQRVALEPKVFTNLLKYAKDVQDKVDEQNRKLAERSINF